MDNSVAIATSALQDGSMSAAVSVEQRFLNRKTFLEASNISITQTMLVRLKYEAENYCRYFTVSSAMGGDGIVSDSTIIADALFTKEKNFAFLLPIADCIGAVLYDPIHQVLGLAHLGRHNLVQKGGTSVVDYMIKDFATDPALLQIFMSTAAGRQNYPLYDFDNRSLHEVATEQLMLAGVRINNIRIDERDTTNDTTLFSHSEFLKGNRTIDGRQAIVCMMQNNSV